MINDKKNGDFMQKIWENVKSERWIL